MCQFWTIASLKYNIILSSRLCSPHIVIHLIHGRNVTAVRCVGMRNVACISASCIPQIPRRCCDADFRLSDTHQRHRRCLSEVWIIMSRANLPSQRHREDKNRRGMFSSFSNNSSSGPRPGGVRNVSQRLGVITASRGQCVLSPYRVSQKTRPIPIFMLG